MEPESRSYRLRAADRAALSNFAFGRNSARGWSISRGTMLEEKLTSEIIRGAIDEHLALGPGLLESAYEDCLCHELRLRGLRYERQVEMSLTYRGLQVPGCYRADVIVEGAVLLELKSVEQLVAVNHAQLLTYLRWTGLRVGLLFNFNVGLLRDGIVRRIL